MEHRACMRSPLKLPITIEFEGREIYCTTRDFGLGGISLELDNTLLIPGSETKLVFSLHQDNTRGKRHTLDAQVAYTKHDGIGLSFSQLDKVSFDTLHALLKFTKKQNLH